MRDAGGSRLKVEENAATARDRRERKGPGWKRKGRLRLLTVYSVPGFYMVTYS